ncbi:hypothetical protein HYPSUDRAFT_47538 [Hypholoma sublateritium FD-334 SS-4]|uniref:Uncharacterized protein n=1 Tax=Hypholoma sublateritium (strain FD-334 SS-4) TaxID=945553 RepID=A0A0D2LZC5_HYPSF|nr:hypothetical protein HYPSUDRAFT_47538 [Hypholoma sublateritium FD-334 SS-4]
MRVAAAAPRRRKTVATACASKFARSDALRMTMQPSRQDVSACTAQTQTTRSWSLKLEYSKHSIRVQRQRKSSIPRHVRFDSI